MYIMALYITLDLIELDYIRLHYVASYRVVVSYHTISYDVKTYLDGISTKYIYRRSTSGHAGIRTCLQSSRFTFSFRSGFKSVLVHGHNLTLFLQFDFWTWRRQCRRKHASHRNKLPTWQKELSYDVWTWSAHVVSLQTQSDQIHSSRKCSKQVWRHI